MRKVKVAGLSFNLLDPEEEKKLTECCEHEWEPHSKEVVVNPAMEFVEGYGCDYVSVLIASGRKCKKCGTFVLERDEEGTSQGDLRRILRYRSYRRTICELLREIRTEVDCVSKVDQCLLMAKKMNDKLSEYCGRGWEDKMYNKRGEFDG